MKPHEMIGADYKNVIFVGVGKPNFREGQVEKLG